MYYNIINPTPFGIGSTTTRLFALFDSLDSFALFESLVS